LLYHVLRDEAEDIPEMNASFIKIFALIFRRRFEEIYSAVAEYHKLLDPYIFKVSAKLREHGEHMIVSIVGGTFDREERNHLLQLFELRNFLFLAITACLMPWK
jgi:hypothetical protein